MSDEKDWKEEARKRGLEIVEPPTDPPEPEDGDGGGDEKKSGPASWLCRFVHRWGKWERREVTIMDGVKPSGTETRQMRLCLGCDLKQVKKIWV